MDNLEINKEIERIMDVFCMKADIATKAMGMSANAFRLKKLGKNYRYFSSKNLQDLKKYIKQEADKL